MFLTALTNVNVPLMWRCIAFLLYKVYCINRTLDLIFTHAITHEFMWLNKAKDKCGRNYGVLEFSKENLSPNLACFVSLQYLSVHLQVHRKQLAAKGIWNQTTTSSSYNVPLKPSCLQWFLCGLSAGLLVHTLMLRVQGAFTSHTKMHLKEKRHLFTVT